MYRFFQVQQEGWGNCLVGLHDEDHEWLQKQKPGKQVKANMKSSRNPDHHRKAFALMKLVLDNHPDYTNIDDVLLEFKLRSGHYTDVIRAGNSAVAEQARNFIKSVYMDTPEARQILQYISELEREAKLVFMPKSIAFDNMGQEQFEELYEQWIDIAIQMLGGDTEDENEPLRREIAAF